MDWVDRLQGLEGHRRLGDSQAFHLEDFQEVHHLALQDAADHREVDHLASDHHLVSLEDHLKGFSRRLAFSLLQEVEASHHRDLEEGDTNRHWEIDLLADSN